MVLEANPVDLMIVAIFFKGIQSAITHDHLSKRLISFTTLIHSSNPHYPRSPSTATCGCLWITFISTASVETVDNFLEFSTAFDNDFPLPLYGFLTYSQIPPPYYDYDYAFFNSNVLFGVRKIFGKDGSAQRRFKPTPNELSREIHL